MFYMKILYEEQLIYNKNIMYYAYFTKNEVVILKCAKMTQIMSGV